METSKKLFEAAAVIKALADAESGIVRDELLAAQSRITVRAADALLFEIEFHKILAKGN